jgi:peptidyl-prolyl cis-trans isomerase SurA
MQQVNNETASYMIFVHELLENKGNQLEDIRGLVVSDYQKKLEEEWIAQLKTKYSVTINESILEQVIEQID